MNKISVPLSDGSCGDTKSPDILTNTTVEDIYSQIKMWDVVDKTLLISMLARDVHHQVTNDCSTRSTSGASIDRKDNTYDSDNNLFFTIVRRTLVQLEEDTRDKLITQSGRYAKYAAEYSAVPAIAVVDYMSCNHADLVRGYIAKGKSVAQCACAFYAGLYKQHLLGNVTKVVIASVLKRDEDLSKYRLEYITKSLTPHPNEDWAKLNKAIEEGNENS